MPPAQDVLSDTTADAILDGRLTIYQPRSGYRFALDAILLADFANVAPGQVVVDFGAGAGVVALILAMRIKHGKITAVELQEALAQCARKNAAENQSGSIVEVIQSDWSLLTQEMIGGKPDHIVCNPPYRKLGTGRLNPEPEEAAARHEIRGSLETAANAAAGLLQNNGAFTVIYPAARLAHLMASVMKCHLEPKRLRLVYSRPGQDAALVLLESRLKAGAEIKVCEPLFVYDLSGGYSTEAEAILNGRMID